MQLCALDVRYKLNELIGQQFERIAVLWLEYAEVPSINGQDRLDIKPLSHCYNARIDKVYVLVLVFAEDLGGANIV